MRGAERSLRIAHDRQLGVEIVVRRDIPADFIVFPGVIAALPAQVATAAEDLPTVRIGLLDGAIDARLATGIGLMAGTLRLRLPLRFRPSYCPTQHNGGRETACHPAVYPLSTCTQTYDQS